MGGMRDQLCSSDIAKMAELGRFDDEFMVYGCAWLEKETIYYYLTEQSTAACRF